MMRSGSCASCSNRGPKPNRKALGSALPRAVAQVCSMKCRSVRGSPAMKLSSATAWNFSSTRRAPIICAARLSTTVTDSPALVFTSRIQTQRGRADAAHLSKQPVRLENKSFPRPAPLDGSRLFSLRTSPKLRTVAAQKNELLRLGRRDPSSDRVRFRGVARQLLHFLATGAAAELSYSHEAPQEPAGQTV